MYLSWSEYYLNSKKANTKSLNVRPIKPHTHANLLKFVCTISVHFYVSVVCAGESGYRCQSLSVLRPFHQPGFYFLFSLLTFDVNFSFFFVLLTESTWDTENENRQQKHGDPFYGQTLCHTWVAKPRYHCIVSSPWLDR